MKMAFRGNLDVAARAASYNVLLQVLLRASTFLMNGVILRFIQAELLGVVNLRHVVVGVIDCLLLFMFHSNPHRLTLLYNSVLFLSREALRKACLTETTEEKKWRHVFNLMWCTYASLSVCLSVCNLEFCACMKGMIEMFARMAFPYSETPGLTSHTPIKK